MVLIDSHLPNIFHLKFCQRHEELVKQQQNSLCPSSSGEVLPPLLILPSSIFYALRFEGSGCRFIDQHRRLNSYVSIIPWFLFKQIHQWTQFTICSKSDSEKVSCNIFHMVVEVLKRRRTKEMNSKNVCKTIKSWLAH